MSPEQALVEVQRIHAELSKRYVGKKATIVSDYNGQDYGSSRPSQRGKTVEVHSVFLDSHGVFFFVYGERQSLRADELEFSGNIELPKGGET